MARDVPCHSRKPHCKQNEIEEVKQGATNDVHKKTTLQSIPKKDKHLISRDHSRTSKKTGINLMRLLYYNKMFIFVCT